MIGHMKRKVCETCGLSLTGTQYDKSWDKIQNPNEVDKNRRKNHNEYRDWYESSKK